MMTSDIETLTEMMQMIELMIDLNKRSVANVKNIRDANIYVDLADFVHQSGMVEGLLQAMKDELDMRIEYLEASDDDVSQGIA